MSIHTFFMSPFESFLLVATRDAWERSYQLTNAQRDAVARMMISVWPVPRELMGGRTPAAS